MNYTCRCQFCDATLDLPQTFRYLVESDAAAAEPGFHRCIRQLPTADGLPLRVCRGCQAAVYAQPQRFRTAARRQTVRRGLIAVGGLLSVGWVLSAVFAPRA